MVCITDLPATSCKGGSEIQRLKGPPNALLIGIRTVRIIESSILSWCLQQIRSGAVAIIGRNTSILQRPGSPDHGFTRQKDRNWDDASAKYDWVKPHQDHLIPQSIWQIILPRVWGKKDQVKPVTLKETATWLAMNPDYTYILVGPDGGKDFVNRYFGHDEAIVSTFNSLPNVGMKSDLLRYLLLYIEGGVYTDTDTVALKPIDDWVPRPFRNHTRLVVGIEFDQRDGGRWADIAHTLQFCQWTIAAAPGHPVFPMMISRVVQSWEDLKQKHNISSESPSWRAMSFEVMNSTGPAAWTDMVWEHLQKTDKGLTDIRDLSPLDPPKLFRDTLILPIDGFGMGQPHSGSNDGSIPDEAFTRHLFRGSWRENQR
ncbi:hypothetical protein MCOR34_011529 [Pyricularia oryzae]|nr:hypothetical protein MCOR34_011529 [Pyricularia oryzae]